MRASGKAEAMVAIRESVPVSGACLYVCSTPIGNLQDVTLRLLEVLRTVDVVAAEDTRHTRKLLTHFDIHPARLVSYHEHNRSQRSADLVRWWQEGKSIALVSDAGTPVLSDPGEDAVQLAIEQGVIVIPVPGPSALLAALVASGLPVQPFTFVGFLPKSAKHSQKLLQRLAGMPGSLVIYEAPHRLQATLRLLSDQLPDRTAVLAKELTKLHETFVSGNWDELLTWAQGSGVRGEFVIVVGPPSESQDADGAEAEVERRLQAAVQLVSEAVQSGRSHREAVQSAVEQTGARRKDVYQATLNRS